MKQILQSLRTGATELADVPAPVVEPGHVLIQTSRTLVSAGTEKMLVNFGKASLIQKVRSQPEKVQQVLRKMRTDGILPTIEAVFRKLDEPLPLGYCNVGRVIGVGAGATGFLLGDQVASNGPHAEVVSVPANLTARIPDGVSDDAAAFTVVGAIALQGVRLARPEFGETVVVIGLGLIGQLTAQLLVAAGCRVVGFDFDPAKVEMAARSGVKAAVSGAELDPVKFVTAATSGLGADAVIITASTSSHDVIAQSARMSRKRGRIVLIGVVGLNINRSDFYEKELTFQVSCSYGPGRYDEVYEEKGYDYPAAFVRWTENRNFQAVLQALDTGALRVEQLITKCVPLANYREIYDYMDGSGLASLLVYEHVRASGPTASPARHHATESGQNPPAAAGRLTAAGGPVGASTLQISDRQFGPGDGALAVIGAGNFTKMTAMPALAAAGAPVKVVVSSGGVTGTSLAKKYSIPLSSTDYSAVLNDPDVRGVIITTRHNLHAAQTVAALQAGKHVLVEKPLCLSAEELRQIEAAMALVRGNPGDSPPSGPRVTVGFNRRFSPHAQKMRSLLCDAGPVSIIATMNAGAIPANHWVHDPVVGGGRLIGEACHFVDLAIFLSGSLVTEVSATVLDGATDTASILLRHENGSATVVNYFANGHRDVSKERVEVYSQGRVLLLDNFRELRGYGFRSFSTLKTSQDKGHMQQFAAFAKQVKSDGAPLIPWDEIANSTRATLAIPRAIAERRWVQTGEI